MGADERKEAEFDTDADQEILTNKWTDVRLFMLGATSGRFSQRLLENEWGAV
jgi:hypothetical protein